MADVDRRGVPVTGTVVDVRDTDALWAAIDAGAAELGTIDAVVNVVGGVPVDRWHRLLDYPLESFDALVATNVRYALAVNQHVARGLVAAKKPGAIVNISSIASAGQPLLSGYGAAKAGLNSLCRAMAAEWGRYDIRVNNIAPGTINTPRSGRTADAARDPDDPAATQIPLGRRGVPNDIADASVFLLSDLAGYITGQTLDVDGGVQTRGDLDESDLPRFVTNASVRSMFGPVEV